MISRRLAGAILCALATGASAGEAKARLDAFFEGLDSLRAHFEQRVVDERGELVDESSGTMHLARPGRFRWSYDEPYTQLIVGDGERVWIYDAELEQVTVKPFDETLGDTPASLLTSEQPIEQSFEIHDAEDTGGYEWVALTPLSPQTSFARIRLGFDERTLRAMELADNFGQTTRLEFTDVERNPALDETLFRFEPPAGADVIGGPDS